MDDGPHVPLVVPMGSQPEINPRPQVVRPVAPVAVARAARPIPAPQTSAYERIAALSAVPVERGAAGGPQAGARSVSALDIALGRIAGWLGDLRLYWRQIGLVSAILLTAGLLVWRLGERGRHVEQELVLGASGAAGAPVEEVDGREFTAMAKGEPEAFDHVGPKIPRGAAEPLILCNEELLLDMAVMEPAIRPTRHHATLREAIEAMKADMARTRVTVQA